MNLKKKANRIGNISIILFILAMFGAMVSMIFEVKFLGTGIFLLMICFMGLRDEYLKIRLKEIDMDLKKEE